MRYILTLMFLAAFTSCSKSEKNIDSLGLDIIRKDSNEIDILWVCHHPDTKFHNQPCVEEMFPAGCYVDGDNHKFCWLLHREDCDEETSAALRACELFSDAD